jgi:hypothetical protein
MLREAIGRSRSDQSLHMEYLLDTADFGANELLRILYLLGATPDHLLDISARRQSDPALDVDFPPDVGERLRAVFTSFKYSARHARCAH